MIQRRRPIESAIAERKMFNMGGMAAPMQQPTYMDLMQQGIMGMQQPQQMGMQQPQGIMASSQPLVDAIAADANNPAGGDTLSMAQGGLASEELMAQGFAHGGVHYTPAGLGPAPSALDRSRDNPAYKGSTPFVLPDTPAVSPEIRGQDLANPAITFDAARQAELQLQELRGVPPELAEDVRLFLEVNQDATVDEAVTATIRVREGGRDLTGFPVTQSPFAMPDITSEAADDGYGEAALDANIDPNPPIQEIVPGTNVSEAADDGYGEAALDANIDPNSPIQEAAYTAANQVASILDTDKEADGKTIDDFKKQFMEAMPKYEGMSEEEKGFLIAEAGLRVMAGKDSNAITNIAEGLKGLGPALMKGEKEKRAWKRQVELSAAKYGLENVARDAAELRADAKAEGKLDSRIWILNDGESYLDLEPGQGLIPTVEQMRNPAFISKFSTQESMIKRLEYNRKKTKANLDSMKEFVTDPSKFGPTAKRYRELSARVGTNYATRGLLNEAISLLGRSQKAAASGDKNKVLGVRGLWRDFALRIGNATGQKDFMEEAFGKSIADKEKFRVFTKGATTKHIEGLIMEGGKITNQERELGLSISGALADGAFSGVFTDAKVTMQKLRGFSGSLDRDINSRFNEMQGIESDWINRYSDIQKYQLDRLERSKGRSYGSRLQRGRAGLRIPRSAASAGTTNLRFSDIANLNKDGTMTGLKKNWDRVTK